MFWNRCTCNWDSYFQKTSHSLTFQSQLSTLHSHSCFPCLSIPLISSHAGWNKASLSVDATEENDGYSSSEDPMNSDPEDEVGRKLVSLNLKRSFYFFTTFIFATTNRFAFC